MSRVLLLLGLWMGGCAGAGETPPPGASLPVPLSELPARVGTSHVELYWRCATTADGLLRLDGVVHNAYATGQVGNFKAEVAGVDQHDRQVSEGRGAARSWRLGTREMSPFALELRPTGREVRFDLYYDYEAPDLERTAMAGSARLAGGMRLARTHRQMVRDACGESRKHRR
jgi:hypothetical protein